MFSDLVWFSSASPQSVTVLLRVEDSATIRIDRSERTAAKRERNAIVPAGRKSVSSGKRKANRINQNSNVDEKRRPDLHQHTISVGSDVKAVFRWSFVTEGVADRHVPLRAALHVRTCYFRVNLGLICG